MKTELVLENSKNELTESNILKQHMCREKNFVY